MEENKEHYGFITAVTMIVGIVIGSGIFFKCDDVLRYTGGSVWLGTIAFCIGAFSIVFGSLTLTELSIRTEKNGGVVGYYEDFISKKVACGFGWFQTFVYYPTIIAVVSWVAAVYMVVLFNMKTNLETQILIAFIIILVFYAVNILSLKLGGYFQNVSTFIKLVALIGIATAGIVIGNSNPQIPKGIVHIAKSNVGLGWLASLAPIAFSFDGWTIASSITNEVKDPKKNMTRALIVGPCIVLAVYLLYFLGLDNMLGPEYIMSTGNNAVGKAGELIFGANGTKIILIFIIIAVLGVVNGLILGILRMPQALASKNMIPDAEKVTKINSKIELSVRSCVISFVTCIVWLFIHYIVQKSGILGSSDISEIAIIFSYLCYILLYIKVINMKKNGIIESSFKGIICPVFAILGSAIILIGGIVSNPLYAPVFIIFCSIVFIIGLAFYKCRQI